MTCAPGLLGIGLSLVGVPRSALPPGIKRIQVRNLDLVDTISKHPCVHMGTPQDHGKEEALCPCALLHQFRDIACRQRNRKQCGVA